MRRASVVRFFAIYFVYCILANLVHPITPAFLQSIRLPSYMFGIAFAALSFANFSSSPFWGEMGDRRGYVRMMSLGFFGYGVGQYLFSLATGTTLVVIGRVVAGFFVASLNVNSMAYLASLTDDGRKRSQYMAIYVTLMSVGAGIGYLIGGWIGDRAMRPVFDLQCFGVMTLALFPLLFLSESARAKAGKPLTLSHVNPLAPLMAGSGRAVSRTMGLFLGAVFLASFASYAHDQSLNYYLRAQLHFAPSGNGIFKAVVGLVALIANATVTMWITRKTDGRKSLVAVLALCSLTTVVMLLLPGVRPFLVAAMIFNAVNSVYLSVQQGLMVQSDECTTQGELAGLFNTVKYAGMVIGPLVSGFIYDRNPLLPFMAAAIGFGLAALLSYASCQQRALHRPLRPQVSPANAGS